MKKTVFFLILFFCLGQIWGQGIDCNEDDLEIKFFSSDSNSDLLDVQIPKDIKGLSSLKMTISLDPNIELIDINRNQFIDLTYTVDDNILTIEWVGNPVDILNPGPLFILQFDLKGNDRSIYDNIYITNFNGDGFVYTIDGVKSNKFCQNRELVLANFNQSDCGFPLFDAAQNAARTMINVVLIILDIPLHIEILEEIDLIICNNLEMIDCIEMTVPFNPFLGAEFMLSDHIGPMYITAKVPRGDQIVFCPARLSGQQQEVYVDPVPILFEPDTIQACLDQEIVLISGKVLERFGFPGEYMVDDTTNIDIDGVATIQPYLIQIIRVDERLSVIDTVDCFDPRVQEYNLSPGQLLNLGVINVTAFCQADSMVYLKETVYDTIFVTSFDDIVGIPRGDGLIQLTLLTGDDACVDTIRFARLVSDPILFSITIGNQGDCNNILTTVCVLDVIGATMMQIDGGFPEEIGCVELPSGRYYFVLSDANGNSSDTIVDIPDLPIPTLDLGGDRQIGYGDTVSLALTTDIFVLDRFYSLEFSHDDVTVNSANPNEILILPSKNVVVTAILGDGATGCSDTAQIKIDVAMDFEVIIPTLALCDTLDRPTSICVEIENVRGGTGEGYRYTYNLGVLIDADMPLCIPYTTDSLQILVNDSEGNEARKMIKLPEIPELDILIEAEDQVELGEEFTMSVDILTSGSLDDIDTEITISPEIFSSFENGILSFSPIENTTVVIEILDVVSMCSVSEEIDIRVINNSANAFTIPNVKKLGFVTHQENNFFSIGTDNTVQSIEYAIFDRWGNKMTDGNDLVIDNLLVLWDGMLNGQLVESGIYGYKLTITFIDGKRIPWAGEYTILK